MDSNVRIQEVRNASNEEWDKIWSNCDHATFYHSREWYQVWSNYTKGAIKPITILVQFNDQKWALIPIASHTILKDSIKRYISSPASSYGAWISDSTLPDEHCSLLIDYLCKTFRPIVIRANPLNSIPFSMKGRYYYDDFTQIVSLKNSVENILPTWSKGHRSALTQARKIGITVRTEDSRNAWDSFYPIYLDSLKRWGSNASSKYRKDFFESIYNLKSPHRQLWLAHYQDQPVAGSIIFYAKKHVTYGYSAVLNSSLKYRPMNILIYEIMQDACQKNFTWFDLCPSGGHQGVVSFKKNFGAIEKQNPLIDTQPGWLKALTKIYKLYLVRFS